MKDAGKTGQVSLLIPTANTFFGVIIYARRFCNCDLLFNRVVVGVTLSAALVGAVTLSACLFVGVTMST